MHARYLLAALVMAVSLLASRSTYCRADEALDRVFDSACRLDSTGPEGPIVGSATVCAVLDGQVIAVTCYHCVAVQDTCQATFYRSGYSSAPITGRVLWRAPDPLDVAFVAFPESSFVGILPAVVPLASQAELQSLAYPGSPICTAGAPRGAPVPQAMRLHITGIEEGNILFIPPPAHGRSGSAIMDAEATRVIGVLKEQGGETGPSGFVPTHGRATLISMVAGSVNVGAKVSLSLSRKVPLSGPEMEFIGCGPGGCSPYGGGPVFPNAPWNRGWQSQQQPQQQPQQGQGQPWGNLPPGLLGPGKIAPQPEPEPQAPLVEIRRGEEVPLSPPPARGRQVLFWVPVACLVSGLGVRRITRLLLTFLASQGR